MNQILIVVDMQPYYLNYYPSLKQKYLKVLDNVVATMQCAISHRIPIIILEHKFRGPSHAKIRQLASYYDKCSFKQKLNISGVVQIEEVISQKNYSPQKFYICGVYYGVCVLQTALDVKANYPKIPLSVIKNACNDDPQYDNWYLGENIQIDAMFQPSLA